MRNFAKMSPNPVIKEGKLAVPLCAFFSMETQREIVSSYVVDLQTGEPMKYAMAAFTRMNDSHSGFRVLWVEGESNYNEVACVSAGESFFSTTCSLCFFEVNNKNEVDFDEFAFGDYPFSSEIIENRLRNFLANDTITLSLNRGKENPFHYPFGYFNHTCKTMQYKWGRYEDYRLRSKEK